jgi:hypothetical protein
MSPELQIVFDCADPHRLAGFWAAATDYEVEDHHDLIEGLIAQGHATLDDSVIDMDGRLAWRDAAACRSPETGRPRLLFQVVPEPKTVKNRVHVDLHVGDEQREALVERLLALGAKKLWDGQQGPYRWITLADLEGNELCVS